MSKTSKTRAKSMINVKRLTFFPFIDEVANTYDENNIVTLDRSTMSFNDSRGMNSDANFGDGVETDREYSIGDRVVEYRVQDLPSTVQGMLHGHTVTANGTVIRAAKDVPPYVGSAVMTELPGGHVNLYKFFKAKFPPSNTSVTQRTGSTTFSETTLSGAYIDNEKLEKDSAVLKDVDPSTTAGSEIIERWFSEPEYYGEDSTAGGGE